MFQRKGVLALWKKTSCGLLLAWNTHKCFSFQHHNIITAPFSLIRTATLTTTISATMPKAATDDNAPSGIMMILSPAKTLDLSPLPESVPNLECSSPDCNLEQTKEIAKEMKKRSQAELAKLLGISANLAKTSHEYWENFVEDFNGADDDESKPSIYSFSGAAYQGLQALECSENAIFYLQDNLRIVDPVYGVLRPLDKMQPYRLEMATKNVFGSKADKPKLSEYWKAAVTQYLSRELNQRSEPILLNLASDEYAAAVDPTELQEQAAGVKYVKVVFRDQGRVVAVHAKRARGLMARFLAEANAKTLDDVRTFSEEGYKLVAKDSDEETLVFDRPKQEKTTGAAKKRQTSSKASSKEGETTRKRGRKSK